MSETFKWKGNDVYTCRPHYSNEMMLNHLAIIERVTNKTIEKKVGRGRNSKTVMVRKYQGMDTDVIDTINNSVEYYTEKMMNKSSIEFRDYQEDIISRGISVVNDRGFLYLGMTFHIHREVFETLPNTV